MDWTVALAFAVALGVFGYLLVALFKPEIFS